MTLNYYGVLGISPKRSFEEIHPAYVSRKSAYPDQLTDIDEAYKTLSNPATREIYDKNIEKIRRGVPSKTVIVFGQSGAGKTSVINGLLGLNLSVGGGAVGCTFKSEKHSPTRGWQCPIEGENYVFWDTAGLNETESGSVPSKKAFKDLMALLKSTEAGISLLIFVIKKGPITNTTKSNYQLFIHIITAHKIPSLLVVTECEHDPDWVENNKKHFDAANMTFNDVVGSCFFVPKEDVKIKIPPVTLTWLASLRKESTKLVWESVLKHSAPGNVKYMKEDRFYETVMKILKFFFDLCGWDKTWVDFVSHVGVSKLMSKCKAQFYNL